MRPARPRTFRSATSCSIVKVWSPEGSPWRLSSSLKPELAEDGAWTGDGASSISGHAISLFAVVISMSAIFDTPFFTCLFLSIIGLVGVLCVAVSLRFWWTVSSFAVGDVGVSTLGATWKHIIPKLFSWTIYSNSSYIDTKEKTYG